MTSFRDCRPCDGSGYIGRIDTQEVGFNASDPGASWYGRECECCEGAGQVEDVDCENCNDEGCEECAP